MAHHGIVKKDALKVLLHLRGLHRKLNQRSVAVAEDKEEDCENPRLLVFSNAHTISSALYRY